MGAFDVVHDASATVVAQGATGRAQWTQVSIYPELLPGEKYHIVGGSWHNSASYVPSYRSGAPTSGANYAHGKGEFNHTLLQVGNSDFNVWSRVDYIPAGGTPAGDVPTYLWVKAPTQDEQITDTLPGGEVVLFEPAIMLGPSLDDTPIDPVLRNTICTFNVPIDSSEQLTGQRVYFQFFAIIPEGPNGTIIISDVFGGVLRPAAAPAASAVSTAQRAELCCKALRAIPGATSQRRYWQRFKHAIRTGAAFPGPGN